MKEFRIIYVNHRAILIAKVNGEVIISAREKDTDIQALASDLKAKGFKQQLSDMEKLLKSMSTEEKILACSNI